MADRDRLAVAAMALLDCLQKAASGVFGIMSCSLGAKAMTEVLLTPCCSSHLFKSDVSRGAFNLILSTAFRTASVSIGGVSFAGSSC